MNNNSSQYCSISILLLVCFMVGVLLLHIQWWYVPVLMWWGYVFRMIAELLDNNLMKKRIISNLRNTYTRADGFADESERPVDEDK